MLRTELRTEYYITLSGFHFVVSFYVGAMPRPVICYPFGVIRYKLVPKGDKYISQGQRPWLRKIILMIYPERVI